MRLEDLENGRYEGGLVFGWRDRKGVYREEIADDWDALEKTIYALNDNDEVECDEATLDAVYEASRVGVTRLTDGTVFHWRFDSLWGTDCPIGRFHLLDGTRRYVPMTSIVFIEPSAS